MPLGCWRRGEAYLDYAWFCLPDDTSRSFVSYRMLCYLRLFVHRSFLAVRDAGFGSWYPVQGLLALCPLFSSALFSPKVVGVARRTSLKLFSPFILVLGEIHWRSICSLILPFVGR